MDRDLRKEFCAFRVGHLCPSTGAEYFLPLAAIGTFEVTHVLNDAEDGTVYLAHHPRRACRVEERHVLRCSHDYRAVERDLLRERELRVAGARRQIDHQKILRTPQRVLEELTDRTHYHRPAPNHRRLFGEEEANRHQLDAVAFDRVEILAAGRTRPFF